MDVFSKSKRSWIMSRIGSRPTRPEKIVESILRDLRLNYQKADRKLPGTPDFAFYRKKSVLFINGCFWHGHRGCKRFSWPKSNKPYWNAKIKNNKRRDRIVKLALTRLGWRHFTIWECEVSQVENIRFKIQNFLHQSNQ